MATSVYCLVDTPEQADTIVDRLRYEGFAAHDISVLFSDRETSEDYAYAKHTKAPEEATEGASTAGIIGGAVGVWAGGALGGALGWLIGIGSLVIPGAGPFIAAGPIMAALSGAAMGATVGGISGALIGVGIPESEAKHYEGKVHAGEVLISVHAGDRDQVARVRRIYFSCLAHDIAISN